MLARFEMIGNIGKITIPEKMKDKECVFFTMATGDVYNGRYYTQWINQISVWGAPSKYIKANMAPGQTWWIAGNFKAIKRGKKEEIMFNVQFFRKIKDNKEETIESLREREMERFMATAAYDEFDENYDNVAYEKERDKGIEKKKKEKK